MPGSAYRTVDYQAVAQAYLDDTTLTTRTVGEKFGIGEAAVSRILRIQGVPLRNRTNRPVSTLYVDCGINESSLELRSRKCRPCFAIEKRRDHLRRKYGITLERYEELYQQQEGNCALCRRHYDKLVVDHCHETGVIRGLLCIRCNAAIGSFGDNLVGVHRLVDYLKASEVT